MADLHIYQKIDQQAGIIASEQAIVIPSPTEDHSVEITKLQILFDQKQALIQTYENKASEIKLVHQGDDVFNRFCISFSVSSDTVKEFANNLTLLADGENIEYVLMLADALRVCKYTVFVNDGNQIMIQAKGLIELLKATYTQEDYAAIKALLNTIKEPNI